MRSLQASDWFSIFVTVPAVICWAAFGVAWLIDPHLLADVDPLFVAGSIAAFYYGTIAFIAVVYLVGWLGMLLLSLILL